jgi:hypothetical protein
MNKIKEYEMRIKIKHTEKRQGAKNDFVSGQDSLI